MKKTKKNKLPTSKNKLSTEVLVTSDQLNEYDDVPYDPIARIL